MKEPMREDAAGRLETTEGEARLLRIIYETTMAKAWLDFVLREYGAHIVIANIPPGKPIWFPPSNDGLLPGVLLARHPQEVLRFLATLDPSKPAQASGAEVQP